VKLDYFIGEDIKDIKRDYFRSTLIENLARTGSGIKSADGRLVVYLPPKLGFCHGVVRAIRMAIHAAEKYPDRPIYLLNEVIHNPFVNRELQKRGIRFLDGKYSKNEHGLGAVTKDDVVIIPAFGGTIETYAQLNDIGCTVIDTTCGEVLSVWKRIQRYNVANYTTLIFGKHMHEETLATSSRARRYLVIKDLAEAQIVADYIRNPTVDAAANLLTYFTGAYSVGFSPQTDLQRVGMASQTTMYANQFIAASNLIRQAMHDRYGEEELDDHFLELDTICSATQERQDALQFLLPNVDMIIVVGGYNSSNTTNLARIASECVPTYHIEGVGKIFREAILHQPVGSK